MLPSVTASSTLVDQYRFVGSRSDPLRQLYLSGLILKESKIAVTLSLPWVLDKGYIRMSSPATNRVLLDIEDRETISLIISNLHFDSSSILRLSTNLLTLCLERQHDVLCRDLVCI